MPTLGLTISPEAFLMGVLRGTSSLLRRSIGAVFSTAGHFAASLQVRDGVVDTWLDEYILHKVPKNFLSWAFV